MSLPRPQPRKGKGQRSVGASERAASNPMCVCVCVWPQHARTLFHRQQCNLVTTLEVGGELFSASERHAQDALRAELATLRDEWDELHAALGRRLDLTRALVQVPLATGALLRPPKKCRS